MTGKLLAGALVVVIGVSAWYMMGTHLTLDWLVDGERQLRGVIEAYPWRAFAVGFAAYVLASIVPGATGKSVVVGWLFGFWPALFMVTGALTIAGVVGFSMSRYLVADAVRDRFRLRLEWFDRTLQRDGVYYLLTVRLLHVPFTFVNYVSGVSRLRLWTFAWTTLLGLVPGTMVLVGLGAGLPSLNELLRHGAWSLVSPTLVAALVAIGAVPWLVRWAVRKLRIGASTDGAAGLSPPEAQERL